MTRETSADPLSEHLTVATSATDEISEHPAVPAVTLQA